MSADSDLPRADAIGALDFTGPVIDTAEGIVTLEGVLLAVSATVMRLADEAWLESAGAVIDSSVDDALEVAERIAAHVELGERLNDCAARHASYGTTRVNATWSAAPATCSQRDVVYPPSASSSATSRYAGSSA